MIEEIEYKILLKITHTQYNNIGHLHGKEIYLSTMAYWENNKLHKSDGPAIISQFKESSSYIKYFIFGVGMRKSIFNNWVKRIKHITYLR